MFHNGNQEIFAQVRKVQYKKSDWTVILQVKKLLANKHFFRFYKLQQPLDTQEEDSISA